MHTPIFFEETLAAHSSTQPWAEHLRYALDLGSDHLFLDLAQIWHEELVLGRGEDARFLLPSTHSPLYPITRQNLAAWLLEHTDPARIAELASAASQERAENAAKLKRFRQISVDVRKEVAARVKGINAPPGSLRQAAFAALVRTERLTAGRDFMSIFTEDPTNAIFDRWAAGVDRFPCWTSFVDSLLFTAFYAGTAANRPLHHNDQIDAQQLCFLTWADVFVSDDAGFLRDCFETLWAPLGKRLYTSAQFAELCHGL